MATYKRPIRQKKPNKLLLVLLIPILVVLGYFAYQTFASSTVYNLAEYYPNSLQISKGDYLNGKNYIAGHMGERNVLWFEQTKDSDTQTTYKVYNYGPEDLQNGRCNYDVLRWSRPTAKLSGRLQYLETTNTCPGKPATNITYSPGITFLPYTWDGQPWSLAGRSEAIYKESGVEKCRGTNSWKAEVLGKQEIYPNTGVMGIHWRTTQTTEWKSGSSSYSGCRTGQKTNWQEDYYLVDNLPVIGGLTAKGLKRSVGGNKDVNYPNWDILFDSWTQLPSSQQTK